MEQEKTASNETMFAELKLCLGISTEDNAKDGLLLFLLESLCDEVKVYCNIETIPTGLERVITRMGVQAWREAGLGQEAALPAVSSVTRGDVSVSYLAGSDKTGASPFADLPL